MITEHRICPVCNTEFIAKSKYKKSLRKTCSDTCAYKLKEINMHKTTEPKINETKLIDLIQESIKKIDCPYVSVRTIIENSNILETETKKNKGLKLIIGKTLTHKLNYQKISKKYYKRVE